MWYHLPSVSFLTEWENLTEALAKQREKYELLQVSYSDHNILHTVTLLTVITMANHARLECGAMQKETLMETMTV